MYNREVLQIIDSHNASTPLFLYVATQVRPILDAISWYATTSVHLNRIPDSASGYARPESMSGRVHVAVPTYTWLRRSGKTLNMQLAIFVFKVFLANGRTAREIVYVYRETRQSQAWTIMPCTTAWELQQINSLVT